MKDDVLIASDIHGSWFTLVRLLNRAPKGLKIVSAGDEIDRGPNSRKVVEFLMSNGIPSVASNHADLCLAFYRPKASKCRCFYDDEVWLENGGKQCLRNWPEVNPAGLRIAQYHQYKKLGGQVPKDVLDWMEGLPPYLYPSDQLDENGRTLHVSHCGYGLDADRNTPDGWMRTLWGRHADGQVGGDGPFVINPDTREEVDDGLYRVFGHTKSPEPTITDKWARIDTGAAYGGGLTGFMWPSKTTLYQPFDETPVEPTFSVRSGVLVDALEQGR